jgi:hypothetical protein
MPAFEFDRNAPISSDMRYTSGDRRRRNHSVRNGLIALVGAGVGIGACGVVVESLRDGVNTKQETVTVCDKEYVRGSEGSGEYRVYVADESGDRHTKRVADTLLIGGTRFNSADTYAQLDRGVTYDITTSGYRIGILSQFPNIIEVEKIPTEQQVNYCE